MTEENDPAWWARAFRKFSALDPETRVVSVAIVGLNVSIHVANRYLPEYLRVLGAVPWIIGLFGSIEMGLGLVYPYLGGEVPEWIDTRHTLTVSGALASLGLLLWLVAPQLGRRSGMVAWGWLFVGLFLVAVWNALGLGTTFAIAPRSGPDGRSVIDIASEETFRWAGLLVGFMLTAGLLVEVSTFVPGLQVALAVTVSIGLTATILQDLSERANEGMAGKEFVGFPRLLADLRALPADCRSLLVGDTIVQFAYGMVATFFVTLITHVLHVEATVLGHHFPPAAFFGVLLAIEVAVALLGVVPSVRIAHHVGLKPLATVNFLVTASFPLLLVSLPADTVVMGIAFAFFGLRLATLPARRALITQLTNRRAGGRGAESYRSARNAIVVPSAVIGGLLYGISPQLAFGLAGAIGLLGTWTFLRSSAPSLEVE